MRRDDDVVEAVLLGEGARLLERVEMQMDLVERVARAGPAHQRIGQARRRLLVVEPPFPRPCPPRLHRRLDRLIDARLCHGCSSAFFPLALSDGRGERIRTSGIQLPKLALYQAELRPERPPTERWRFYPLMPESASVARKWPAPSSLSAASSAGSGPSLQRTLPMTKRSIGLSAKLHDYILSVSLREPEILRQLREETAKLPLAVMQVAPDQGQFMQLLVRLTGARSYLEIGTFTGYSTLAVALALPPDGRILACDINPKTTEVAQRYWTAAGVASKIELVLAPALETLDKQLTQGQAGRFDLAFIDADKENYDGYYERALRLVRPGGLILLDNVLWDGAVADPKKNDADTKALRAVNKKIQGDERVDVSMLPLADGLTLARKR